MFSFFWNVMVLRCWTEQTFFIPLFLVRLILSWKRVMMVETILLIKEILVFEWVAMATFTVDPFQVHWMVYIGLTYKGKKYKRMWFSSLYSAWMLSTQESKDVMFDMYNIQPLPKHSPSSLYSPVLRILCNARSVWKALKWLYTNM